MSTQFFAELDGLLGQKKTLSLYDVQRMLDSDNIAEVQEIFAKYAYESARNHLTKHFMVTRFDDCSSQVVSEKELTKLCATSQVDDASLLYLKNEEASEN
mmetsp:Transcript_18639/g.25146  ORF Transcript_18639/g.25146 Transcript_18639/m.25146 type:complete len:100 (+) Transcript_18639:50-349(+)